MEKQYILPLALGIGIALLFICVIFLLHKLVIKRGKAETKRLIKTKKRPKSVKGAIPVIAPQTTPGFMLPTWRSVAVQEPLRRNPSGLTDDTSSEELDVELMRPRNNNQVPISTVIKTKQRFLEMEKPGKMEPVCSLRKMTLQKLSGSISLQDLNVHRPKQRLRPTLSENFQPTLKFAMYYSAVSGELNVTVINVANLNLMVNMESANVYVWVQVEFSKYHQEFRTKNCSGDQVITINETCVVTDFPVEHFTGSRISFRVMADDSAVIAEAVYVVLGLPPSFPKNETIELQHPGIVETTHSRKTGEMFIRLKYDPVDETVTLEIIECRGLKSDRKKTKLLDTYVKGRVIFCNETVQKFKTNIVAKNNNPKYNKTITLSRYFTRVKMEQTLIRLTVYSKSIPKQGIGYIVLGRTDDSTSSGYQHWESIIDKPSLDIVQWHTLKPTRSMTP